LVEILMEGDKWVLEKDWRYQSEDKNKILTDMFLFSVVINFEHKHRHEDCLNQNAAPN
jgi:hypothetical protein